MPIVTGLGKQCTGHGCWPARPIDQVANEWCTFNGIPIAVVGDHLADHTCPTIPETHDGVISEGSSLFTLNGSPVARVGDAVSCGGAIAEGIDFFNVD